MITTTERRQGLAPKSVVTGRPWLRPASAISDRLRAARSAIRRAFIAGQLGPNVGRPHDRWPEPPF